MAEGCFLINHGRSGGKDASKLDEALAKAKTLPQ
jgi:hypothetical protein